MEYEVRYLIKQCFTEEFVMMLESPPRDELIFIS